MTVRKVVWSMVIVLIIATMVLSTIDPRYETVNPAFRPYVDVFEFHYKQKVISGIEFRELEDTAVGTCYFKTDSIAVDPTYWKYANETERLILILHELGHCDLRRLHIEGKFEDGCPQSLMHPTVIPNQCFERYQEYYITELFQWNM